MESDYASLLQVILDMDPELHKQPLLLTSKGQFIVFRMSKRKSFKADLVGFYIKNEQAS